MVPNFKNIEIQGCLGSAEKCGTCEPSEVKTTWMTPELIPVKDSLEAALNSTEGTVEAMRAGVELTLRQLKAAFDKGGLRELDPVGEKFDPNRHQAISAVPSTQDPNTVVSVLQKGYLIAERTLRPALVTVAKKPDNS